jgi:hypothetical protein
MRILTVGQPRTSPPSHIHSHTHSHTPTHTDSHTHTQTAGPANTFRQREELPKMLLMGCCQTAVEKKKKTSVRETWFELAKNVETASRTMSQKSIYCMYIWSWFVNTHW